MTEPERKPRFSRGDSKSASITPVRLRYLEDLAHFGWLMAPQAATLQGSSEKAARNHLRQLYELKYADKRPVPLASLLPGNSKHSGFGLGPDLYKITQAGLNLLERVELIEDRNQHIPRPDTKGGDFLHVKLIHDFSIWLYAAARHYPDEYELLEWHEGDDAAIYFESPDAFQKAIRPDAWFRYRFPDGKVLLGFLEMDRGTERGMTGWAAKTGTYANLFRDPWILKKVAAKDFDRLRVLCVAPNKNWAKRIREKVIKTAEGTQIPLTRFAFNDVQVMEDLSVHRESWYTAGSDFLRSP